VAVGDVHGRRPGAGDAHRIDPGGLQLFVIALWPLLYHLGPRAAPHVAAGAPVGLAGPAAVCDLDLAVVLGVAVRLRPQGDDLVVQPGADLAGRAYDHALAGRVDELAHLVGAGLPVGDEVGGDRLQALWCAVEAVHHRDGALDPFPFGLVQTGGQLV